jgi:hypothetical protein
MILKNMKMLGEVVEGVKNHDMGLGGGNGGGSGDAECSDDVYESSLNMTIEGMYMTMYMTSIL